MITHFRWGMWLRFSFPEAAYGYKTAYVVFWVKYIEGLRCN